MNDVEYATIKEWLEDNNFDWQTGEILLQTWARDPEGYQKPKLIDIRHAALHRRFNRGLGTNNSPCILARDKDAIYIISLYDGATRMHRIELNWQKYLSGERELTWYGGG